MILHSNSLEVHQREKMHNMQESRFCLEGSIRIHQDRRWLWSLSLYLFKVQFKIPWTRRLTRFVRWAQVRPMSSDKEFELFLMPWRRQPMWLHTSLISFEKSLSWISVSHQACSRSNLRFMFRWVMSLDDTFGAFYDRRLRKILKYLPRVCLLVYSPGGVWIWCNDSTREGPP